MLFVPETWSHQSDLPEIEIISLDLLDVLSLSLLIMTDCKDQSVKISEILLSEQLKYFLKLLHLSLCFYRKFAMLFLATDDHLSFKVALFIA